MITEIGIAAGNVWGFLDKNGRVELSILINSVPGGKDLALMALGWLARESHVFITQNENQMFVELSVSNG